MSTARTQLAEYGITVDSVGDVVAVDHEPETEGACPFHNPSISPLVFAPIRYSAAVGLVRVCSHGFEHPDRDDQLRQREDQPIYVKTVGIQHDRSCDGCCVDSEPITKRDDPGTHRADTGILDIATLREVQQRVAAETGVIPVQYIPEPEPPRVITIPVAVQPTTGSLPFHPQAGTSPQPLASPSAPPTPARPATAPVELPPT